MEIDSEDITRSTSETEIGSQSEHSIEDISTNVPTSEASTDATSRASKRKRGGNKRPESEVWKHVTKGEPEVIVICKTCKFALGVHSHKNATTRIRNHLFKCVGSGLYKGDDGGQRVLTQDAMGGTVVPHQFNQKRLEDRCVSWIIRSELPFTIVEDIAFKEYIKDLQPKHKIPNRKEVATGVWELFQLKKAEILSMIGDLRVSIAIDTWTSLQNINYMVVTAHFLDDEWKLHKRVINFIKITSHKGEDIGRLLEGCLCDWGIWKVFSITVDNATSNDKVIDYMKKRFKSRGELLLNGIHMHVRCTCHIINLIVKDGMKELVPSIEGIRNCVKFIHSSAARLDMFRKIAILENMDKMSTIPLDVDTRWNSTYLMLLSSLKYKVVFAEMVEENDQFKAYFTELVSKEVNGKKVECKREGPPSEEDWEKVNSFTLFLKHFYDAILSLSARKTPTSNLVLDVVLELQFRIEDKIKDKENLVLQNVASCMKMKFDKYFGKFDDMNPIMFVAQALDPRYKLDLIENYMKALGMEDEKIDEIKSLTKKHLKDLLEAYNDGGDVSIKIKKDDSTSSVVDERQVTQKSSWIKKNMFLQRKLTKTKEIRNEVDKYLDDPFADNDGFDLLDWWKLGKSRYPIMSKIARDVLALPSSTVASENAFSLGERVVDPFRASLTPKMAEALVCTNDWLRGDDEFQSYNEPTKEEVEFYKECEEIEKTILQPQLQDFDN